MNEWNPVHYIADDNILLSCRHFVPLSFASLAAFKPCNNFLKCFSFCLWYKYEEYHIKEYTTYHEH